MDVETLPEIEFIEADPEEDEVGEITTGSTTGSSDGGSAIVTYMPRKFEGRGTSGHTWDNITTFKGEDGRVYTKSRTGKIICGGKNRLDGLPCGRRPALGRNRCKLH